jgi:hypothetical protein
MLLISTIFLHELIVLYKFNKILTKNECFILLIIGLCHDIGHVGKTNQYNEKYKTKIFRKYGSNEKMHYEITKSILTEYNILYYNDFIEKSILSTNIDQNDLYINEIKNKNKLDKIDIFVLLIKCADLSHFTKPFNIHQIWVDKIHKENNIETDKNITSVNFIDKIILPMFHLLYKHFPLTVDLLIKIDETKNKWLSYEFYE